MLGTSFLVTVAGAVALASAQSTQDGQKASDAKDDDVVVVTGSRLDQRITEIGASVTIISEEEIERLGADFLTEAIATAPGVTVNQNGAFGGAATVRIRGALSEQTLVLIDGVPVNDASSPGGGFDFARLDTENVAKVEILKGPQSTLWGTDAVGGVVSITTKAPERRLGGSAFLEGGSFGTARAGASIGNAGGRGDFRLAVTGLTSDGISKADEANGNDEKDGYEALTLSGKGGLNLPRGARLSGDVLYTEADTEFDSFDFGAQGSVADGDERSETEDLAANLSLTLPLMDGRLDNLFLAGLSTIDRQNVSGGVPGFAAQGQGRIYRYQGTADLAQGHVLAFGAEREESRVADEEVSIDGVFALYEWKPSAALTLTGGLRHDEHERFGGETTGRAAAALNVGRGVTLRASFGEGFKAPTLFQTSFFCCGATAPNAQLRAERSEAFDIGADWRAADGRASASVTFFDQEAEDQIDFSFVGGAYVNIAEVHSRGVELAGRLQPASWLEVSANYAYIDAEDGAGRDILRLPAHTGDVSIAVDPRGPFSAALFIRYNGEESTIAGTTLQSWTRADLTARYALSERTEIFGRVENLLDETYQQILGYGTPGLSGSVGLRLRY